MNGTDYIVIAVIALVLISAAYAIWRSKKKGRKCIGCPHSGSCSSCGGACGK